MRHSQAVKSAEFEPWIASEKSETVICAHCNCKAGLREARAVLFLLIAHSDAKLELTRSVLYFLSLSVATTIIAACRVQDCSRDGLYITCQEHPLAQALQCCLCRHSINLLTRKHSLRLAQKDMLQQSHKLSSKATAWRFNNEETARQAYQKSAVTQHKSF